MTMIQRCLTLSIKPVPNSIMIRRVCWRRYLHSIGRYLPSCFPILISWLVLDTGVGLTMVFQILWRWRLKCMYVAGTILVAVSFPFIFIEACAGFCHNSSIVAQLIYYAPFVALFQIGWAMVQVAHMALLKELPRTDFEATELSGYRWVDTSCSGLFWWLIL